MAALADDAAPRQLHEQHFMFHAHSANLHYALSRAEHLEMDTGVAALAQSLAVCARNTCNFKGAADLYARLAHLCKGA